MESQKNRGGPERLSQTNRDKFLIDQMTEERREKFVSNERLLVRRFAAEVGTSPAQVSRVIGAKGSITPKYAHKFLLAATGNDRQAREMTDKFLAFNQQENNGQTKRQGSEYRTIVITVPKYGVKITVCGPADTDVQVEITVNG